MFIFVGTNNILYTIFQPTNIEQMLAIQHDKQCAFIFHISLFCTCNNP